MFLTVISGLNTLGPGNACANAAKKDEDAIYSVNGGRIASYVSKLTMSWLYVHVLPAELFDFHRAAARPLIAGARGTEKSCA